MHRTGELAHGVLYLRFVEERRPLLVASERPRPFGVITSQGIRRHMKVSRLDAEGPSDCRMDLIPGKGAIIGNVEVLAEGPAVAEKPNERHGEVAGPSQRPG